MHQNKKRLAALLLALCLVFSLTACGNAAASQASAAPSTQAQEEAPAVDSAPTAEPEASVAEEASAAEEEAVPDYDEVFAVVHTNDVHGNIDVEPYVKAVVDDLRSQYGQNNVVTVNAGDVFAGGNAVAHLYLGETIPPIIDAAGYDLFVPGNNDYNFGADQLLKLTGMFEKNTTPVCSNLYTQVLDEEGNALSDDDGNRILGEPVFDRTLVRTTEGGVKVGLFGLTVVGGSVDDIFATWASAEAAQDAVDILQADGCSVIIGVGHTGWNDDLVTPATNDITSAELVKQVPGIDAYIDGHSHSIINDGNGWTCPETGAIVNQASCKGECIGVMRLYIKDGQLVEKSAELIHMEQLQAEYTPDPEVQKVVDEAWTRLAGDAGEMYYDSPIFLNGRRASENEDGRSIRTDETNLGDLVTDGLRWNTEADVVMVAGFHLRASLNEGKIYAISLYDVFANGCDLYEFQMTGQELIERLAKSLLDLPNESTQFNQISGASFGYTIDEAADDGTKTVTIIDPKVGGVAIDLEKNYTVYIDAGGPDAPADQDPVISGMESCAEKVGEYLKSGEATVLPDEPIPDGRIVPMTEIPDDAVVYEVKLEALAGGPGGAAPPPKP